MAKDGLRRKSDPVFEKMNRSLEIDAVLLDVDIPRRPRPCAARCSRMRCAHARRMEGESIRVLKQILSEYSPENR